LAAAHAERGPRIDLRGTASNGSIAPYMNSLRANSVRGEVALSMPLFDSGLRSARIAEAQEANQADWRLIDQAAREVRASVSSNWDALAAARSAIGHYSAAVAAAQRAYDGAVLQQRAGARTTLDVLNLARDLLDVRTRYVGAVANEYIARANLLSATGMLEASLLIPDIDAYDPGAHLRQVDHRGDVPLLTPAVRALDSVATGGARNDRVSRDPAATTVADPQMRALPAAPVENR
jgi:outer membrane protein TolC